jgi:hypothetical protein
MTYVWDDLANVDTGYMDVFAEGHYGTEPVILAFRTGGPMKMLTNGARGCFSGLKVVPRRFTVRISTDGGGRGAIQRNGGKRHASREICP